jgi:hypothetical protein
VLSEYREDKRSVGFYRLGDTLLMRQDAPIGEPPLISPSAIKGLLPSQIMAAVTQSSPPAALVEVEGELDLHAVGEPNAPVTAPIRPKASSVEGVAKTTNALTSSVWFRDNYCDSQAYWEAFRTSGTPANFTYQYYWGDRTANKQVTYTGMIFGYSAVANTAASGVVTNKMLIDDGNYAQAGAVVQPGSANYMYGWSNKKAYCGFLGCCCFYLWNVRKFTMGVVAVDPGDRADICGFGTNDDF